MSIDTIERPETEIADQKGSLEYDVDELQERGPAVVDWRGPVERHPLALLGAVAVGGMLVAALLGSGSRAKALRRRASDKQLPAVKRVVRDTRRKVSRAATAVAERLSVPTAWEESRARRPKQPTT
jgi:hypothetical protein